MGDLISRSGLEMAIKRQYCTDCNSYDGVRCRACHADDMLALVDDMVDAGPRWISVEERLPDKGVFVVVYYGHFIGNLMDVYMWDGECWRSSTGYLEDAENITHWMPLPEPPEEE